MFIAYPSFRQAINYADRLGQYYGRAYVYRKEGAGQGGRWVVTLNRREWIEHREYRSREMIRRETQPLMIERFGNRLMDELADRERFRRGGIVPGPGEGLSAVEQVKAVADKLTRDRNV
jgi:hypothetical protein